MSEQWKKIKTLFTEASRLPPDERDAFLDRACADDASLREEVRALLDADARPGPFDAIEQDLRPLVRAPLLEGSADPAGEQVGPYTIINKIGQGGMGIVYKARDRRLDRFVALKFLPRHLQADAHAKGRFFDEARAASALDHPNICTIYDIGETDDRQLYIAMAYYSGRTLAEIIADPPPPLENSLDITMQLADALGRAHEAGIVHRDVKPSNIMVTERNTVKILDFGVAKLDSVVTFTRPGMQIGTMAYMSPEQIQGEDVDHRTDIWSLGVVLYELLTGHRPFDAPYSQALLYAIAHEAPPSLSHYQRGLPPALESIVYKCLEKDRTHRYPSATALLADLRRFRTTGTGPRAQPATVSQPVPGTLPPRMTSFVGRKEELTHVQAMLATTRLLTLTGPAGTGKTRLALQAADAAGDTFPDGIFFVSLAPITDSALVISAIAQTLGVVASAARPVLDNVKAALHNRHILLVLDNVEHVTAAASVIAALLEACATLKVLVTSRTPLRLSGEQEFPVPPLALPDASTPRTPAALQQVAAIRLFIERAQAVRPDFTLTDENAAAVAELCTRLDGLPLAIELAAARIKLFSPQAMLARLSRRLDLLTGGPRDHPERHQTLRQAIAWSYDLLDPPFQTFFRRLSVFVNGCTMEAAEAVCARCFDETVDIIEAVATLVDQNLLRQEEHRQGEPRFVMLETIRAYGLERLDAAEEAAVAHRAHATYYLHLAEEAAPHLTSIDQVTWLDVLDAEHDNLRTALNWCEAQHEVEMSLRIGGALWRFWIIRGHLREGRQRLERLLHLPDAHVPPETRARVLNSAGTLMHESGDYAGARGLLEKSLAFWRETDDTQGIATVLNNLGWIDLLLADFAAARSLSDEALALSRQLDDRRGMALSYNNLGWIANFQGDFATAGGLFQKSLDLRRSLDDRRGVAFALTNLAWTTQYQGRSDETQTLLEEARTILEALNDKQLSTWQRDVQGLRARYVGDYKQALTLFSENIKRWRNLGSKEGISFSLTSQALTLCDQDCYEQALPLLEESIGFCKEMGTRWHLAWNLCIRGRPALALGSPDHALALFTESLAIRRAIGDKQGIAECLEHIATVAAERRAAERAVRLFGAAAALRQAIASPLPLRPRNDYTARRDALAEALGDDAFARAWAEGQALAADQAVALALER